MKKLAIIGAGYLQLPLVEKAKAMGVETHCFAWKDGAVCKGVADFFYPISILEKEKILEVCEKINIDGILTIACDIAIPTVNYVAKKLNLIANDDTHTSITTNKYAMRMAFEQNGVPSPKFKIVKENQAVTIKGFRFPLIVKPTDRSGSLGVEKVEDQERLLPAIEKACGFSFAKEVIVEEFVEGREISVETISWKGEHFILTLTDKVTTDAPYFVELAHHQPSDLPSDLQNEVKLNVVKALNALHIEYGASHSELKITPQGEIFFMEIGARMGGDFIGSDLVWLSTGYDFLKGVIAVALGKFEEPIITMHNFSGAYFLSKETEYLKKIIENKRKYPQIVRAEITDENLVCIKSSNDRSGYLIYQDKNRKWKI